MPASARLPAQKAASSDSCLSTSVPVWNWTLRYHARPSTTSHWRLWSAELNQVGADLGHIVGRRVDRAGVQVHEPVGHPGGRSGEGGKQAVGELFRLGEQHRVSGRKVAGK